MPRYGHKSDPQTHADEILMTASVGLMIFGTSRSSKRTSRGPYRTAPRIVFLLPFRVWATLRCLLQHSASACGVATIHRERLAHHKACACTAEPEHSGGNFLC